MRTLASCTASPLRSARTTSACRLISKSLTLNYKRVLYVPDPTDAAGAARGKRVRIEEREDGSMSFWHGEAELLATAFPKEHGVRQGDVVESKRLSATMDFIRERQRERIEAKVAKPSTTLRCGRLLPSTCARGSRGRGSAAGAMRSWCAARSRAVMLGRWIDVGHWQLENPQAD